MDPQSGIAVATQNRIIFVAKGMFAKAIDDVPFSNMKAISYRSAPTAGGEMASALLTANFDALAHDFRPLTARCKIEEHSRKNMLLVNIKPRETVEQAAAMMEETIDNVGAVPREVSADAGYYSAKAVGELYALGVDPFVAPEQTRHGRVVPPAPRGRIPSHLSPKDRMRRKLQTRRGRQRYALRMQTVEPVFGQIKQGRGFRQFLLRGLEKVNGEWSLICTGHNLLKLFRFGVNLHRKARADGPAQRIRNFAEVVSTALFAKLSGGRLGQPAKLVVAIHWR